MFGAFYGKKAQDLFKKNFTTDSKKTFSIGTKTADGVKYGAEATLNGNNLSSKLSTSFKCGDTGLQFKKLDLSNSGKLDAEVLLTKAVDNVTFKLVHSNNPFGSAGKKDKTEITAEYAQKGSFTGSLTVSPVGNVYANLKLDVNATDDIQIGGDARVAQTESGVEAKSWRAGASYGGNDGNFTATLDSKMNLGVNFYRQHSSDITFAAQAKIPTSGGDISTDFGGQYKVNGATISAKLSAPKPSVEGATASFNYSTKVNAQTSLDLTSVINLDNNDADFFGSDFGLKLKFGC